MHQREHISVVAAQQLPQVRAAGSMAFVAFRITHCANGFECLGNLFVQLGAVGYHHERPVAHQLAQHLLGVEHHGKALAAALRLPEHTAAPVAHFPGFQHGGDGIVYTQELVVLRNDFDQPCLVLGKQREVFHQIQQAGAVTGAAQHDFQ